VEKICTILWFGKQLVLKTTEGVEGLPLPEKEDPIPLVMAAIEALEPRPKTVRIIYQPADLEMHAVDDMSKGNRNVIADTLGADYPALRNPATVWSASRLHKTEDGRYGTLLWIDSKLRLARLRGALEQKKIKVEGAWPLVSVLEEVEPTKTPNSPAMAVVLTDAGGFVYAVAPGGGRTATFVTGYGFRQQLGGVVKTALSHYSTSERPPVLVVDGGVEKWDIGATELADSSPLTLNLEEILAVGEKLPPRSLANFLPRELVLRVDRILQWATVAVAAAAVLSLAAYYHQYRGLVASGIEQDRIAQALRAEVATYKANQAKMQEIDQLDREMETTAGGRMALLKAIMRDKPREVTVHTLTISNNTFAIQGTAHEGAGSNQGPYYAFLDKLAAENKAGGPLLALDKEARPAVLPEAEFTINGTFK